LTVPEIINSLAQDAALEKPADYQPGQVIEATLRTWDGTRWHTQVSHLDPHGLIPLDSTGYSGRQSYQTYLAQLRAKLAQDGPSLAQPTVAFLNGLTGSPAQLYDLLDPTACPAAASCTEAGVAWTMFNDLLDLARQADVIVPPVVRAGMLQLIASFNGVTAEQATVAGHDYWAVGIPSTDGFDRLEALVDPISGRIVGQAEVRVAQWADGAACSHELTQRVITHQRLGQPLPAACDLVAIPAAQRVRTPDDLWSTRLVAG
jgi:hypothetical protein